MRAWSLFLALSIALGACSGGPSNGGEVASLRKELVGLRNEVSALQQSVKTLQAAADACTADINDIRGDAFISKLQLEDLTDGHAILSPDTKAYQFVHVNGMAFMVSVQSVAPYADGQRVVFQIGNPHAVTYERPVLKISWGKRRNQASADATTLNEKREQMLGDLAPGSWTTVPVVFAPAERDDVGYLDVSLETNVISMRRQ